MNDSTIISKEELNSSIKVKQLPSEFIEKLFVNGESPIDCCESLFKDIKNVENEVRTDIGSLACPRSYFLPMAEQDYSNYRWALIREFIQNSNDAGAKNIKFIVNEGKDLESEGYGIVERFTVKDDGCGMDKNILFNKLLCLGGSGKEGENGAVGAFGKAKELLFFAWERYAIVTNNLLVLGQGGEYTVYEIPQKNAIKGTHVYLNMWYGQEKENVFRNSKSEPSVLNTYHVATELENFVRNYNGEAKITMNDKKGKKLLTKKTIFIDNDSFLIEYRKKESSSNSSPFKITFFTGEIPTIIKEIYSKGPSKYDFEIHLKESPYECLTSNRDGLKGNAQIDYEDILKDLEEFSSGGFSKKEKEEDKIIMFFPEENQRNEYTEQGNNLNQYQPTNCDDNSLTGEQKTNEGSKTREIEIKKGIKTNFPYAFFMGSKSSTLMTNFCNSQQRIHLALNLWNKILQDINGYSLDGKVYPGLIFSRKVNEEEIFGFQVKLSEKKGDMIFLNPEKFNWKDLSTNGLLTLVQKMLILACHELAHVKYSYHDTYFCSQEGQIYRTMIEKNPNIVNDLVNFCKKNLSKIVIENEKECTEKKPKIKQGRLL